MPIHEVRSQHEWQLVAGRGREAIFRAERPKERGPEDHRAEVVCVWVGAEDRSVHFTDLAKGQGASMALPIWALYMQKCYTNEELNISKEEFEKPDDLSIELDCNNKAEEKEGEKTPDPTDEIEF